MSSKNRDFESLSVHARYSPDPTTRVVPMADIAAGRLDTSRIDATPLRIGCDTEPR